jgi:uncharacterized membrane protein
MNYKTILFIFIAFIIVDLIWLIPFAGPGYQKMIKKIQGSPMKVRIFSGFIVYVFMTTLIYNFGVNENKFNWLRLFLLGLCTYGVYDFTAYAVINDWNLLLAIGDTIWGGILFMIVGYLVYKLKLN